MHMVELKLNMNNAQKPKLVNSLDQGFNHLLIRMCSKVPFYDQIKQLSSL